MLTRGGSRDKAVASGATRTGGLFIPADRRRSIPLGVRLQKNRDTVNWM